MRNIVYIIILLLLFSCNDVKQKKPQLPYVKFTYLWPGLETCRELNEKDVLGWNNKADTIITDSSFYDKFTKLLNSIPNDSLYTGGDFRIVAQIYHRDSTMSVMCCDGVFGISKVDNMFKKQSPELMDFLNHLLYNEDGYRRLIVKGMMSSCDSASVYTEEGKHRIDEQVEWLKAQGMLFY